MNTNLHACACFIKSGLLLNGGAQESVTHYNGKLYSAVQVMHARGSRLHKLNSNVVDVCILKLISHGILQQW